MLKKKKEISVIDFDKVDNTKVGATIGVIAGIIIGMKKNYDFKKTAIVAVALGIGGAYIAINLNKTLSTSDDEE